MAHPNRVEPDSIVGGPWLQNRSPIWIGESLAVKIWNMIYG